MEPTPQEEPYVTGDSHEREEYEIYERNSYQDETKDSKMQTGGSEFKSKLLISKMATKEIENEAKTLANRIALLENEEKKVLKKIEETKKKALDIMQIKNRNKDASQHKEKTKTEQEKELNKKREEITQKKVGLRNMLQEKKQKRIEDSHSRAFEVKDRLKKLKDRYKIEKKEEQLQNIQQVNNIRTYEKEVEIKKLQLQERVKTEARQRYDTEILQQEQTREKLETEIQRLENRERELIKRLKNTQNFHQLVVEDLDRIVNNQNPENIKINGKKQLHEFLHPSDYQIYSKKFIRL